MIFTLTELRAMYPALQPVSDSLLTTLGNTAEESIGKYLGRNLLRHTATEWHRVGFKPRLYLRRRPVHKVLYLDLVMFTDHAYAMTEGNVKHPGAYDRSTECEHVQPNREFVLTPESGLVDILTHPAWLANTARAWYAVRYDAGYAEMPSPVKLAAMVMTAARWASLTDMSSLAGITQERIGDYSVQYGANQSTNSPLGPGGDQAKMLLEPYLTFGINGL